MPTMSRTGFGIYSTASLTPRNIWKSYDPRSVVGATTFSLIDGTLSRDVGSTPTSLLRCGVMLGKITTGGKLRPSIIGLTTGAVSAGTVTSITVAAATATEVARLIVVAAGNVSLSIVGAPTAGGTVAVTAVTATAASSTTITISSATLPAIVVGSAICPADGSINPTAILPNVYGMDVISALDGTTGVDQELQTQLLGGDLLASQIPNLTLDAGNGTQVTESSVEAYFKAKLQILGNFTFSDNR